MVIRFVSFFFFKQKTAYEMRISDWSSDVCSSDLEGARRAACRREVLLGAGQEDEAGGFRRQAGPDRLPRKAGHRRRQGGAGGEARPLAGGGGGCPAFRHPRAGGGP